MVHSPFPFFQRRKSIRVFFGRLPAVMPRVCFVSYRKFINHGTIRLLSMAPTQLNPPRLPIIIVPCLVLRVDRSPSPTSTNNGMVWSWHDSLAITF